MNVRTIREEHKQLELKYNFESHDLDILGIQEHRIMHDEIKYKLSIILLDIAHS